MSPKDPTAPDPQTAPEQQLEISETQAQDQEITSLLSQLRSGDTQALDKLFPLVYAALGDIANRHMRRERVDHTLQATVLVNEAYLQMVKSELTWNDQAHFRSVAARVIRNILIDHARAKRSQKRGGDLHRVTLLESQLGDTQTPDVMDLDEALKRLAEFDERKAKVIELSFFGGLTYDEISEVLEISAATVDRDLRMAKAWLGRELSSETV